jgi:hypothetical protein
LHRRDRPNRLLEIPDEEMVCVDVSSINETISLRWVRQLLLERVTTDRHPDVQVSESLIDFDGCHRMRGKLWGAWRRGFHVGRDMWRRKSVAELRALWEILLHLFEFGACCSHAERETSLDKVIVDFTRQQRS